MGSKGTPDSSVAFQLLSHVSVNRLDYDVCGVNSVPVYVDAKKTSRQ